MAPRFPMMAPRCSQTALRCCSAGFWRAGGTREAIRITILIVFARRQAVWSYMEEPRFILPAALFFAEV